MSLDIWVAGSDITYILDLLSNAFDLPKRELSHFTWHLDDKLRNVNKADTPNYYSYLHDSQSFLLWPLDSNIKDIFYAKDDKSKKNNYISLYTIAVIAMTYRSDIEGIDIGKLKSQFETTKRLFAELRQKFDISDDELIAHKIDSNWTFPLRNSENQLNQKLEPFDISIEEPHEEISQINTENLKRDLKDIHKTPEPMMDMDIAMQAVDELIRKKRYDSRFTLLIKEYFKRSIIVYKWSEDVFYKKLENYGQNIDTIVFEKIKEEKTSIDLPFEKITAGNAGYSSKKLSIGKNIFNFAPKNFISSAFHEQEHFTDNSFTKRESGLPRGYGEQQLLDEYSTEIGATRLLGEPQFSDSAYTTHLMRGYHELQCAGSMMAAAFGIPESEFAVLRDKGNAAFNEYFQEKFPYMNISAYIDTFSDLLKKIHLCIPSKSYSSTAYAEIYNLANTVIKERIAYEKNYQDDETLPWFKAKTAYESYKIAANMIAARKIFGLSKRILNKDIIDNSILKQYSKITKAEKAALSKTAHDIYSNDELIFDNHELKKYVQMTFLFPAIKLFPRLPWSHSPKMLTAGGSTNFSNRAIFMDNINYSPQVIIPNELNSNNDGPDKTFSNHDEVK